MGRETLDKRREKLGGSLWLIPLLVTIVALALGWWLGRLTGRPGGPLGTISFPGGPEEARRILITVATATISVFAVVVGLTLVALQIASNRYSPRLARSILRDRPTQVVLGLFVATFAYNASGLYTVGQNGDEAEYPRLAVTVGIVLLSLCIAALVYYVDRVAHTIQLHWILHTARIGASRAIKRGPAGIRRPTGRSDRTGIRAMIDNGVERPSTAIRIAGEESGYVQRLRPEPIIRAAAVADVVVWLEPGIGYHTVAGTALAWAWRPHGARTSPDVPLSPADAQNLAEAVRRSVTIGWARSAYLDISLSAIELVDVALLSMHIFDYHTVEQSTAELSVLLCELAPLDLGPETFTDSSGTIRLVVPARKFRDYLDLACGEIRRKGASEPVVLLALVRLLRAVGLVAGPTRADDVEVQLDLVRSAARRSISETYDADRVLAAVDEASEAIRRRNARLADPNSPRDPD
ncbi:DUF2254 domain-containing protein [Salana multivorans]